MTNSVMRSSKPRAQRMLTPIDYDDCDSVDDCEILGYGGQHPSLLRNPMPARSARSAARAHPYRTPASPPPRAMPLRRVVDVQPSLLAQQPKPAPRAPRVPTPPSARQPRVSAAVTNDDQAILAEVDAELNNTYGKSTRALLAKTEAYKAEKKQLEGKIQRLSLDADQVRRAKKAKVFKQRAAEEEANLAAAKAVKLALGAEVRALRQQAQDLNALVGGRKQGSGSAIGGPGARVSGQNAVASGSQAVVMEVEEGEELPEHLVAGSSRSAQA